MSRPNSFGRQLPALGWQRWAPARSIRLWARPARVVAIITLGALIAGNALILYRLSSNADDPSTAFLSTRSGQEAGGSFDDVGTTLEGIQASIEARVGSIDPIDIAIAPSQDKRRETNSHGQAGDASGSSDRRGSGSTLSDSSAGSSVGSASNASTSGGSASAGSASDDGGGGTAGAEATGGGGTTGDASSDTGGSGGGSTGSTGGTSGGGGGGGGSGTDAGSSGGSGEGTAGGGGGGG